MLLRDIANEIIKVEDAHKDLMQRVNTIENQVAHIISILSEEIEAYDDKQRED